MRLMSLIFMVLVSVGFVSGIGTATDKIDYSLTDYYKAQTVSDYIIKSTDANGFTEEDVNAVEKPLNPSVSELCPWMRKLPFQDNPYPQFP